MININSKLKQFSKTANRPPTMKYKLIIFDFDGTLADTFPWFASVINRVAEKYHFRRIEKSESEMLRNSEAQRILKFLGLPFWKIPIVANHMRTLMARDIHQIPLFEGIESLLHRLSSKGMMLAVVSSNSYENIRRILGPEMAALIRYYECGASIFGKKAKLKKIINKSGVLLGESMYIGDEIRDIEAAKKLNIAFGGVSWGYNRVESLKAHSPGVVFATVDEIAEKTA